VGYLRRFIRDHRPSPALVVASVALLAALGGTGIAAVANVPDNSVGTAKIKNNAVTTPKIKNNAVNASKIAGNAVNASKIANNAVTGSEIKNASIQPADLSAAAKTSGATGPAGPSGPQGPPGVAPPGYIAQVASDTATGATATTSTTFVDLNGAEESITVPTGETARLYVTFSAESFCSAPALWCSVRITVNGAEIEPIVGTDYAFDSGSGSTDSWEGHSLIRVSPTLAAGTYIVRAQFAAVGGGTATLDDWALVVERVRVS
jgi:hypothetical protein